MGTSGWAYKEWKPDFYPAGVPQKRFLEHYATKLNAVEVNATFYRPQPDATIARWRDSVGDGFRFALKAHRVFTLYRAFAPDGERKSRLEELVRSAALLGDRLGPILFQFPARRERDDGELARFLDALPRQRLYALEFGHPSWQAEEVQQRCAASGAAVCLTHTAGDTPRSLPPGPVAYVRLRAPGYDAKARQCWRALLEDAASARDVYVFAKHKGIAAGAPEGGVGLATALSD